VPCPPRVKLTDLMHPMVKSLRPKGCPADKNMRRSKGKQIRKEESSLAKTPFPTPRPIASTINHEREK